MSEPLRLKYIIVQPCHPGTNNQPDGPPVPILIPNQTKISHRDVASIHSATKRPVRGAGFCDISRSEDGEWKVVTHGRSETLERDSSPEDAEPILKMLRGEYEPY